MPGGQANLLCSSTHERNETQNEMMWMQQYQRNEMASSPGMGLHSSAGRALQRKGRGYGFESHWSPPPHFFWGGGATLQLLKLQLQLRWSHIHFICISAVHIISFWVVQVAHWLLRTLCQTKRQWSSLPVVVATILNNILSVSCFWLILVQCWLCTRHQRHACTLKHLHMAWRSQSSGFTTDTLSGSKERSGKWDVNWNPTPRYLA